MKKKVPKKLILDVTRSGGLTGWTVKLSVFSDCIATIRTNNDPLRWKKLIKSELEFLVGLLESKLAGLDSAYLRPGRDLFHYTIIYRPQDGTPMTVVVDDNGSLPESLAAVIEAIEALITA